MSQKRDTNPAFLGYFSTEIKEKRLQEIYDIASPIIESFAFQRLRSITFLGILSPTFSYLSPPNSVLAKRPKSHKSDGTRYEHSIGVAALILEMCNKLNLSNKTTKIGLAWALLHDISTWPLSHTGEAAFSHLTNISSGKLRKEIILGSRNIPECLSVRKQLDNIGIDKDKLLRLYRKSQCVDDNEIKTLWSIIHSPITPDTLEGIWRSGYAFRYEVPLPHTVLASLAPSLFGPIVIKDGSNEVLKFWRVKSDIYQKIINNTIIVQWESCWTSAIKSIYSGINLLKSLLVPEQDIVKNVVSKGLPEFIGIERYKPPMVYSINPVRKRVLDRDHYLSTLCNTLEKKQVVEEVIK